MNECQKAFERRMTKNQTEPMASLSVQKDSAGVYMSEETQHAFLWYRAGWDAHVDYIADLEI